MTQDHDMLSNEMLGVVGERLHDSLASMTYM